MKQKRNFADCMADTRVYSIFRSKTEFLVMQVCIQHSRKQKPTLFVELTHTVNTERFRMTYT